MSDDRFNQAPRSLHGRQGQRQAPGGPRFGEELDDDLDGDFEDEATALVDLSSSTPSSSAPARPSSPPPFGPPPIADDPTDLVQVPPHVRDAAARGGQPQANQQANPQANQVFVGDEVGYEGVTEFVNIRDFAESGPPDGGDTFAPDADEAGYEGHTQLVDLHSLQAQQRAQQRAQQQAHHQHHAPPYGDLASEDVENDPVLRRGYQFGPGSVQHGEITLVFAQNMLGKAVILKRVWEGDPTGMPAGLRQRIATLDQIRHPRLVPLNGMLATATGAWVELDRPAGRRLTDILQQNGPQPVDDVTRWARQAAEVIGAIHGRQFIYGNLTTDAVWVQDDGSILLEPFDVLTFENRGNLGVFGPPELDEPPERRHVWPATDVYSLAAVMVAALSGLPVNLAVVTALDKRIARPLQRALTPDPTGRPQTVEGFVASFDAGGGLPELNIRMVIALVFIVGSVTVGYLYWEREQQMAAAAAAAANAAPTQVAEAGVEPRVEPGLEPGSEPGSEPAAALEGMPTQSDPRLQIVTSYRLNPLPSEEDLEAEVVVEGDPDRLRAEARALVKEIDRLRPSDKEQRYTEALQKIAAASRASGGPTAEDRAFLAELFAQELVQTIAKDYKEKLNKALEERNMSSLKSVYPKLASIDAEARDIGFFTRNKSVGVRSLKRAGSAAPGEEDQ